VVPAAKVMCELSHFSHKGALADISTHIVDFFTDLVAKVTGNRKVEVITSELQVYLLSYIRDCALRGKSSEKNTSRVKNRLTSLKKRMPEILAFVLNEPGHFTVVFLRLNFNNQVEVFCLDSNFTG